LDIMMQAAYILMHENHGHNPRRPASDVVQEALQKVFSQPRSGGRRRRTRLTTFRGRGILPGVDLDSSASLLDVMEGR